MPGRRSIVRLIVATALVGLDLGLVRSWIGSSPVAAQVKLGPDSRPIPQKQNWPTKNLGEFGPIAALGLLGLSVAILTGGRSRWFFLGAVVTGISTSTIFFFAPASFRHVAHRRVIGPIEVLLPNPLIAGTYHSSKTEWMMALGELMALMDENPAHQWSGFFRCPILYTESQIALGLIQVPLMIIGGSISAWFRVAPRTRATPRVE
jgi:hypothetical protein